MNLKKTRKFYLMGFLVLTSFYFYGESCRSKNRENLENPEAILRIPNIPDKDPVPIPVVSNTLWCRYRTIPYGRLYEQPGLDEKQNVITFTGTNGDEYFWSCPDPYLLGPFSRCPRFLNNAETPIYSDTYFIVNDTNSGVPKTPEHIISSEFRQIALKSCHDYTPHEGSEFVEYGIRSENDVQPHLFHKPFFNKIPQNIDTRTSLPFTRIVVFGDSISDNGYFWDSTGHLMLQWPYFMGRFSNGPVWIDFLEKQINIKQNSNPTVDMYNYSVGGSGTVSKGYNYGFSNLDKQVSRYLADMSHGSKANANWDPGYDKTLYILFLGTNDYFVFAEPQINYISDLLQYCNLNPTPTGCASAVVSGNTVPSYTTLGIKGNIEKIIKQAQNEGSGKEMFFLIPNEPNLALLPYYNPLSGEIGKIYDVPHAPTSALAFVSLAYQSHNKQLNDAIEQLRNEYPKIHFLIFDLNEIFRGFILDMSGPYHNIMSQSGIVDKIDPCFIGSAMSMLPSFKFCFSPASHFFWDQTHPSTTTHCDIAELATKQLYAEFVPKNLYVPEYTKCHQSYVKNPLFP